MNSVKTIFMYIKIIYMHTNISYIIKVIIQKIIQNLPGFETGFGGAGRPGVFTVAAIVDRLIIITVSFTYYSMCHASMM